MKRKLQIIIGLGFSILAVSPAFSAAKIIACPALSAAQYGKTIYYDPQSGKTWRLTWKAHQKPVWSSASIPQTVACRNGKSKSGLTYQCVHLQCQSAAVTANIGENQNLQCFSAYVSTQNKFYCDDFTVG